MDWRYKSWPEGKGLLVLPKCHIIFFLQVALLSFWHCCHQHRHTVRIYSELSLSFVYILISIFLYIGHHSSVTITLQQLDDRTELTLHQTGIPEMEFERTQENWSKYYWGSIKQVFCYGMKYF